MSEAESRAGSAGAPSYDKGDRAAIVSGREGVGVRGQVFWVGENKYGPGMRYGLRGDDGVSYWVDGSNLGPEEGAPPPPPAPERTGPVLQRGDRARIVKGPSAGVVGEVFWTGDSRYGAGMRYGIRDEGGEAHWVDDTLVEADGAPAAGDAPRSVAGGPGAGPARSAGHPVARGGGAPPARSSAPPPVDDLPPDDELPPEAYEDAFSDDDIPF